MQSWAVLKKWLKLQFSKAQISLLYKKFGLLHFSCAQEKDTLGFNLQKHLMGNLHSFWEPSLKNIMSLLFLQSYKDKAIRELFTTLLLLLIIMAIFWESKLKVIFQELEILMNPPIICKAKVDILSLKLSLEKSLLTFAMGVTTLFIGWDLVWMVQRLFSILQLLLTDYQNHYGVLRLETQPLPITISLLASIELAHKSTLMSLQAEIKRLQKDSSATFMEVHTLQLLMDQELLHYQEQEMEF